MNHMKITKDEVLKVLKCIKVDKSPETSKVHPWNLWETREVIMETLEEISV